MIKATLEFYIDDFDDRQAHLRCVKANNMASVITEFANNSVYKCIKYNDELSDEYVLGFTEALNHFNRLLESEKINLEEI